jgi:intraflagellar transport protein 20
LIIILVFFFVQAIGLRNKVESEQENRKRKQQELQADILQKRAELDRYEPF